MSAKRCAILTLSGAAVTGLAWLALAAPGSYQEDTVVLAGEKPSDKGFVVLPTVAPSMKASITPQPAVTPSPATTATPPAFAEKILPIMDPYAG